MDMFRDRVAVITAASGIDLALAEALARKGMRVALLDVRCDAVMAAATAVGTLGRSAAYNAYSTNPIDRASREYARVASWIRRFDGMTAWKR